MYANEKYSASVIFNAANSSASEESAESTASGHANAALYFGRGPDSNNQDIWTVPITRDGERSALLCPSPSSNAAAGDAAPTLRADGREILF